MSSWRLLDGKKMRKPVFRMILAAVGDYVYARKEDGIIGGRDNRLPDFGPQTMKYVTKKKDNMTRTTIVAALAMAGVNFF